MNNVDFVKLWEVIHKMLKAVYDYVLGKLEDAE